MRKLGSILTGIACSGLWISAAFVVAFPMHMFALDWTALSVDFIHNTRNEAILIPFLLLVDVIIAGIQDHLSLSKKQGLVVALALAVYALVVGIAPDYMDADLANGDHSGRNHLSAFIVVLMSLGVVRFVTLLPKRFRKFRPTQQIEGS